MAVSRKPAANPAPPAAVNIDRLLNRGLSEPAAAEDGDQMKPFPLRLPKSMVDLVDQAVAENPVYRSRNAWILETVYRRLQEEGRIST